MGLKSYAVGRRRRVAAFRTGDSESADKEQIVTDVFSCTREGGY